MDDKLTRIVEKDVLERILPTLNHDFLKELPASPQELLKYATRRTDPVISDNITYALGQAMLDYRMSDEDYLRTFFQVVHTTFAGKTPSKDPKASILISQTGAGKTKLRELVLEKQGNTVIVNPDLYKKYNPNISRILQENPTHLGALTGIDSYDHANNVRNLATTLGYSLLFECAPSEKQGLVGIDLDALCSNNYESDFYALAVGDLPSSVAIHSRYELELKKDPLAKGVKLTDLKRHDDSYKGVITVLKDLPLDRVSIYRRGNVEEQLIPQQIMAENQTQIHSTEELLSYLRKERYNSNVQYVFNRERPNFLEDFQVIKRFMQERNAPPEQFQQLEQIYDRYITFKYESDGDQR